MDIVMDALVDKLVPSTSAISGAIGDMISTALNNTLGRFLYMIVTMINWFISVAYQLFEVFSGQLKVSYKGEPTYLTSLFFENSTVSGIYWGMAVIGVVMCFAFTIIAVIRKMFDGSDKMQTNLGAILGSMFKSIILILALNVVMVAILNFTNVLMQQVIYVFNAGSTLTEEQEIDFTDEQFATMGRVLNTIGNYSLNPSYNSRYNLNSCYNEIRGDLLHLQQQGVFEFYYLTKDANGEEIETWQSALQTLIFAANPEEELKMDVYNEGISNALLDIMETLETNSAFYPLDHYERTPASAHNIPFDRVLFLACTYNAALNEQFNINPSHTDPLRGPYYSGEKNIYDFFQVSEDFNLVFGFNYIIFFLIAYGIWKEMFYILLDCTARIYNMVLLYLVAPPFIAITPLDGGGKMKQWTLSFVVQCFGIFGTVVAMRLLVTFAPIIISSQLDIFPNAVMDIVAKCILVYGCALTARKASNMFTGILAESAGWQSITAGSLRGEHDQNKRDWEASRQQKKNAAQQQQQSAGKEDKADKMEKDAKTAESAGKLAAGGGNLRDVKNVKDAVDEEKQKKMDDIGAGPMGNDGGGGNGNGGGNDGGTPEKVDLGGGGNGNGGGNDGGTPEKVDLGGGDNGNGNGDGENGPYSIPQPPPMPNLKQPPPPQNQ